MTRIKLVLRTSKRRPNGQCPIWFRFTSNRRSAFVSTGYEVLQHQWDEKWQQVKRHPLSSSINEKLSELNFRAQRLAHRGYSAQDIKRLIGKSEDASAYFQEYAETLLHRGKYWEHRKYLVTLRKLRKCFGEEFEWSQLSHRGLAVFEGQLREQWRNGANTIRNEMKRIRRVLKQGVIDGNLDAGDDPFLVYRPPKARDTERVPLHSEQIRAIETLSLAPDSMSGIARDAFILAYYGAGVRFGDVCLLTQSNFARGRLRYRMLKTGGLVDVPVAAMVAQIVEARCIEANPYLFPFLRQGDETDPVNLRRRISSANVRVNRALKDVAAAAGIEGVHVTFHIARNSFADHARQVNTDLNAARLALGHSSLDMTQTYLRSFDSESIDLLYKQLFGDDR